MPSRPFVVLLILLLSSALPRVSYAQIDEDQIGGWYMLFWNTRFDNSRWGLQGDIQHRNFDLSGDLEQLLIRGGVTYSPESMPGLFTLGYANISTGTFGPSGRETGEHRIYQEGLFSQSVGERVKLSHRFRFEQRWVDGQDFRARLRYALFANVPLNRTDLKAGAVYLSFYNELFLNANRDIGNGRRVDFFDRNRTYAAFGYSISDAARMQFGYMHQSTDNVDKGQIQLSLHATF